MVFTTKSAAKQLSNIHVLQEQLSVDCNFLYILLWQGSEKFGRHAPIFMRRAVVYTQNCVLLHTSDQYRTEFTSFMKADTRCSSFRIPSEAQMPLLTSTPFGRRVRRASWTFSGLIPPANSQPCLLLTGGNSNCVQSNPSPLQQKKKMVNRRKKYILQVE